MTGLADEFEKLMTQYTGRLATVDVALQELAATPVENVLQALEKDPYMFGKVPYGEIPYPDSDIMDTFDGLDPDEIRKLPGYRRVHELFAAPEINKKVELMRRGYEVVFNAGNYYGSETLLLVSAVRPYSESPDAALFSKNRTAKPKGQLNP